MVEFKNEKFEKERPGVNFEELARKRKEIYKFMAEKGLDEEVYAKFLKFARKLQAEQPDYQNNSLYHLLVGSTLAQDRVFDEADFPGEYSIVKFIDELYREYIDKTEK